MSFFGVQEIIENCNYLNALNEEKGASTEILAHLPPYEDPKVRALEERLRAKNALDFDTIFNEPTGFYLLTQFLVDYAGVDRLLFLKDVEAYIHMRFENARVKVANLIRDRYFAPLTKPPRKLAPRIKKKKGEEDDDGDREDYKFSVFDAIKRRNHERRLAPPSGLVSPNNRISMVSAAAASSGASAAFDPRASSDGSNPLNAVTPRAVGGAGDTKDEDDESEDGEKAQHDPDSVNSNTTNPGSLSPVVSRNHLSLDEKKGDAENLPAQPDSPAPPAADAHGSCLALSLHYLLGHITRMSRELLFISCFLFFFFCRTRRISKRL